VLCHFILPLIKLQKEGLDGNGKIKGYIWWISLAVAILEALTIALHSLPYSIYAASHRFQHILLSTSLLKMGYMIMIWICEKISTIGFGHGIICAGILIGYSGTLYKMLARLSGSGVTRCLMWLCYWGFLYLLPCGQYWSQKDAGRSSCSIMHSS